MVSDVCEMYGMFSFPSRAALPRRSVQPYVGVSKFKEDVKKISVCSALFMCISLFYGFVFFLQKCFFVPYACSSGSRRCEFESLAVLL